ncbi:cytochrome c [Bradyrhizobium sp. CCGUVB23]|uniref:cytochrome c n=1 Tax=Bradyrhizobium sp. CCGUVB23 TaxID=2949630 RepID=UPI0020B1E600|nr:cytochrome c [Bradyrhizobium sp. CCGUVB23]MCP3463508.1 cytochrome c [Bradyrhizobium sp. CCGUVB23]
MKRTAVRIFKWTAISLAVLSVLLVIGGVVLFREIVEPRSSEFGTNPDEAKKAGLSRQSLRAEDCDRDPGDCAYFSQMDKGLLVKPAAGAPFRDEVKEIAALTKLSEQQIRDSASRGQNAWLIWTGGNDRFWDYAASHTAGAFDLLKTISSHQGKDGKGGMAYGRHNRWSWLGLVNEPCFTEAKEGDKAHFGLWLDQRDPSCAPDPFADPNKYPGVPFGARGKTEGLPVGSYYGEPTGVVGLRLFPNPKFDEEARKKWDVERYYNDPSYYNDATLVRPYRVGMSCAFCHVGPSAVKPPADPENPKWENLASNPGAQYYWVNRIFFWNTMPRKGNVPAPNEGNFLYQLFHTNPPGSLDTSLVSTDYLNNPRTMNTIYNVLPRLKLSLEHGAEQLKGGELDNKQFQDYPQTNALPQFWSPASGSSYSMRVLKDGADSVGTLGALNRVYLNIGLFSEEWLLHFRPFIGGRKITPIKISDAQKQSVYWQATEDRTADMAVFFLVTARPDLLKDIPEGAKLLAPFDSDTVKSGQKVFAENCAACHSSKAPNPPANSGIDDGICAAGGSGPNYRLCWDRYWEWAQSEPFKKEMYKLVTERDASGKDAFLPGNYLSSERRVPVDLLQTNACTPLATNGLAGDIWDNFTSSSYKTLPPVKELTVQHPVSGASMPLQPLGNGRGYSRPASLIGLWSTAPFLSNNSVGHEDEASYSKSGYSSSASYGAASDGYAKANSYSCPAGNEDDPYLPCVANRMKVFDKSIRQMLNPSTRRMDAHTQIPVPGYIYRTTAPACLMVASGYMPSWERRLSTPLHWLAPWAVDKQGGLALGPLPKDFPINTLTNTKLLPDNDEPPGVAHYWKLAKALPTLAGAFKQMGGKCSPEELSDPQTQANSEAAVRDTGLIDTLVGLSKCPDYVVNRGHYFGADLSKEEKENLIAYLKYF